MRLQAVHRIRIGRGNKVLEIRAGEVFDLNDDEARDLIHRGAVKTVAPQPAVTAVVPDAVTDTGDGGSHEVGSDDVVPAVISSSEPVTREELESDCAALGISFKANEHDNSLRAKLAKARALVK